MSAARRDDGGEADGYKVPEKVGVSELMAKDAEDESLRRYKEQLLGQAAKGMVGDPNDTRRVVITELRILLPERPDGDVVYSLATPEDVKALKGKPFVMKEKAKHKLQISFRVQHDIVAGLQYKNKVYKAGIPVYKYKEMLGSYAPQDERYSVTVPRREWEEAPSGWLARGNFTMQTTFTDDDGVKHLDLELPWELKTGWE